MFRQSYSPFARIDLQFPIGKVKGRRKLSLAQRLEEQDRRLKQLSFEGLPLPMQLKHQPKVNKDVSNNCLTEDDVNVASNSLNSCPATHDDGDLLAYPDSPMTHPPRTVIVRTGDLHEITTPRTKNSRYRKRLFSIDFSTICTEREETSLGEEEDLSEEEENASAASFGDEDYGGGGDNEGGDEWESSETVSISTYPPRSIMLFRDHLDAIATSHRNRMDRSYSDLSSNCSSNGKHTSLPQKQAFPSLPKLAESELLTQEEYEPLRKPDVTAETEDDDEDQIPHAMCWAYREETDEDEDQNIPHVMSCPDMLGDSEDEDDYFDFHYAKTHAPVRSIGIISCPGRMLTDSSIDSIDL